MRKKLLSTLLATAMAVTMLAGCGSNGGQQATTPATDNKTETSAEAKTETSAEAKTETSGATGGGKVGVAMPTKDLQRWNQDGSNMQAQLEAAGYDVDLQYASNDIPTQVSQIENMINSGCELLVIASIDGDSLGTVLEQAKEKDIPVIAYDRLIMNSDAVTYYATFDNYMVGTKQGEYIRDQLDLDNAAGPFNIELVTGDPGDNNARFFFGGAMDVLQPYIDAGKLVVKSGQTDFETVATANWSTETAQSRMDAIISGEWPIITGQDCDKPNVKNMISGKQSMSIFKDTRTLASKVVEMVDAVMKGGEAPVNDTTTYDNGTGVIPSYLCEPVFADASNYKELLIDSGYYTEADLQ